MGQQKIYRIEDFREIDGRKLMDLYQEGNVENIDYFYPGTDDREGALKNIEKDFLKFVEEDFLAKQGNAYWILEAGGVWVSALRINRIGEGFYYLEALETHPLYRRKGYAAQLLGSVIERLKEGGSFRLCDCVSKRNAASLAVHRKCGFTIAQEKGIDYLHDDVDGEDYGMQYEFAGYRPVG